MWKWLKSWKHRRSLNKRLLFHYHDGERERLGDPFLLWRQLMNHDKLNLETMTDALDKDEEPETTIFVESVAEVFGIKHWDDTTQTGMTDWEVIDLFCQLHEFFDGLKKNTSLGLTLPEPTASESSTLTEPLPETTKPSSDSGSAPSGPSCEKPTGSSAVPKRP